MLIVGWVHKNKRIEGNSKVNKQKDQSGILKIIQEFFKKKISVNQKIYKISQDPHAVINLSFYLEDKFEIEFEEYEWNKVKTVSGVMELTLYKIKCKESELLLLEKFSVKEQFMNTLLSIGV